MRPIAREGLLPRVRDGDPRLPQTLIRPAYAGHLLPEGEGAKGAKPFSLREKVREAPNQGLGAMQRNER
jgi:hypothetical protein